jgi:hypothetical protein
MMRYEDDFRAVEAGEQIGEVIGRAPNVKRAQGLVLVVPQIAAVGRRECGIVAIADRVELRRRHAALRQTPAGGGFGQFPRRERHARLAVLASREALSLSGRDDFAVDDECRRRVMENRVNPEDDHEKRSARRTCPKTRLLETRSSNAHNRQGFRLAVPALARLLRIEFAPHHKKNYFVLENPLRAPKCAGTPGKHKLYRDSRRLRRRPAETPRIGRRY